MVRRLRIDKRCSTHRFGRTGSSASSVGSVLPAAREQALWQPVHSPPGICCSKPSKSTSKTARNSVRPTLPWDFLCSRDCPHGAGRRQLEPPSSTRTGIVRPLPTYEAGAIADQHIAAATTHHRQQGDITDLHDGRRCMRLPDPFPRSVDSSGGGGPSSILD